MLRWLKGITSIFLRWRPNQPVEERLTLVVNKRIKPMNFSLGSLAILVNELVPIPLKTDSKNIQTLFLRNEVHIICWQAFSMTTVVVLCILFSKITFMSVLHKREWNLVRLLVQKFKIKKQAKTHQNTKALGRMHFDRSGTNQAFFSSHLSKKHTIQNHTLRKYYLLHVNLASFCCSSFKAWTTKQWWQSRVCLMVKVGSLIQITRAFLEHLPSSRWVCRQNADGHVRKLYSLVSVV